MQPRRPTYLALGTIFAATGHATAAEFYVGGPEVKNGLEIVGNYLVGIEMEPMPAGSAMGADAVHLELDIHAAEDEPHGFSEDAWMPYLTITYAIEKVGADFKKTGQLMPMTARDGSHYANNITMGGPGQYHVKYLIEPPSKAGFVRHVDKVTGVPEWWAPFTVEWTFNYPAQAKK